jgi:hypothetical protein
VALGRGLALSRFPGVRSKVGRFINKKVAITSIVKTLYGLKQHGDKWTGEEGAEERPICLLAAVTAY